MRAETSSPGPRPTEQASSSTAPMQSGLLTETFSAERLAEMAADDWRRRSANFLEPNLSRNLALRDALRPIAERHRTTVSAVAVAWTLAWPGVTGAIVGARTPKQVDGWIGAASLQLTPQDLSEISSAAEGTRAGAGPVWPYRDLAPVQVPER